MRTFRQAALFGLLGVCLLGAVGPRSVWAQEPKSESQNESSEPRHKLLYKTINFIILVGALGYVLRKPASEFFRSRSASIEKGLEEGRQALVTSQAKLQEAEAKLARLESEIAEFKNTALREMDANRVRMEQATAEEAARLLDAARAQIETTVRAAKLELNDAGQRQLVTQFVDTLNPTERKN
jgi:F0F1-type ATP synthase membrane subunit b/b'